LDKEEERYEVLHGFRYLAYRCHDQKVETFTSPLKFTRYLEQNKEQTFLTKVFNVTNWRKSEYAMTSGAWVQSCNKMMRV
jgi:hypothetical protein